jgi:hypothetical protein
MFFCDITELGIQGPDRGLLPFGDLPGALPVLVTVAQPQRQRLFSPTIPLETKNMATLSCKDQLYSATAVLATLLFFDYVKPWLRAPAARPQLATLFIFTAHAPTGLSDIC